MTQEVHLPNGDIISFPDSMSVDQINSAVKQHLGAGQDTSSWRTPKMLGGAAAKGAVGDLGIPGDLETLYEKGVGQPLVNAARSLFGAPKVDFSNTNSILPTSKNFQDLGKGSLWDRPDLVPQNALEKYGSAAAQGVGAAGPFGVAAGPAALIPTLVQGGAAGAGGEALKSNYPSSWPGANYAEMAGNVIGGAGAGKLSSAVGRVFGQPNAIAESYKALGLEPSMAGDISGSPVRQRAQAMAAASPGGHGTYEAWKDSVNNFGSKVNDIAEGISPVQTFQEAALATQKSAKNWLDNFTKQGKNLWSSETPGPDGLYGVDHYIGDNARVDLTPYATTLDALTQKNKIFAPLTPTLAGRLNKALKGNELGTGDIEGTGATLSQDRGVNPFNQDQPLPSMENPFYEVANPLSATWKDVKGARTRLGEMLDQGGAINLPAGTSMADVKRLYGALSDAMGETVANAGPQAEQAFAKASAFTKAGHDYIDQVAEPFLAKGADPNQAAATLLATGRLGGLKLQAMRQEMPDAADALAAAKLRESVKSNPNTKIGNYDPTGVNNMLNELSPEAYDALYGTNANIPHAQLVSKSMSPALKITPMGATSAAGELGMDFIKGAGVGAAGGAVTGHELAGWPGAVGGATLGALGGSIAPLAHGYVASKLSSTPWYTDYLSRSNPITPNLYLAPAFGALGVSQP